MDAVEARDMSWRNQHGPLTSISRSVHETLRLHCPATCSPACIPERFPLLGSYIIKVQGRMALVDRLEDLQVDEQAPIELNKGDMVICVPDGGKLKVKTTVLLSLMTSPLPL